MNKPLKIKKQVVVLLEQDGIRLDTLLSPFFDSRSQAEKAIKKSLIYRAVINQVDKKKKDKKREQRDGFLDVQSNKINIITKPSHKVRYGEVYYISSQICEAGDSVETKGAKCATSHLSSNKAGVKTHTLQTKDMPAWKLKAYYLPIPILFEDDHLLVINKPAGVPVHPGPGHEHDTLVNALVHKTTLSTGTAPLRPGIVHRLDKEVSGLMILSKTKKAEELLIQQFKDKKVYRIYRTLTVGRLSSATSDETFSIVSFIGRHPKDRKKFYSFKRQATGTKQAITHCRRLKSYQGKIHYIECQLETGRTHQIRVHLKSQGLPILGDTIYFPLRKQKKHLSLINFSRDTTVNQGEVLTNQKAETLSKPFKLFSNSPLALYSAELRFSHPIYNKTLFFNLPWPKEFHPLLKMGHFPI